MAEMVAGAQVVGRVAQLLKLVGERPNKGHAVADLAGKAGLSRPTVHRLLVALQAAGLVEHDPVARRWHLGREAYVLGVLAQGRFNIEGLARDSLIRLADRIGDTTFLSVPRGTESACLFREEGAYPIRTHVLQVGDRLPFGVGSASLAFLAALPAERSKRLVDESAELVEARYPGHTKASILASVEEARTLGYAVNRGSLLKGSWGVAAVVLDARGSAVAALSIAAVEARLQGGRLQEVGHLLEQEAESVGQLLSAARGDISDERLSR